MNLKPNTKVNTHKCKTCPFRTDGRGLALDPSRIAEIQTYLMEGTNHFCHSDRSNNTICRGGRDFQLTIWYRLGVLSEPTDKALLEAMLERGIELQTK